MSRRHAESAGNHPGDELQFEVERRASAIGIYNFLTGLIYVAASLGAGALWAISPVDVFLVAAVLCLAAMLALGVLRPDLHR